MQRRPDGLDFPIECDQEPSVMRTDFDCGKIEGPKVSLLVQESQNGAKGEPEQCKSSLLFRHVKGKLTFVQSIAGTK